MGEIFKFGINHHGHVAVALVLALVATKKRTASACASAVAIAIIVIGTQRIVAGSRCARGCCLTSGLALGIALVAVACCWLVVGGGVGIDVLLFAWLGSDGRGVLLLLLLLLRQFTVMVEC